MSRRSRVLLADDHALIRAAFASLLQPVYDVVGAVSDGRALLDEAPRLRPDVIVADVSMPLLNGLDACQQLRPLLPALRREMEAGAAVHRRAGQNGKGHMHPGLTEEK